MDGMPPTLRAIVILFGVAAFLFYGSLLLLAGPPQIWSRGTLTFGGG